ncbi:MAG: ABC transporter permease [Thermomicrobiales bacterium]
MRSSAIDDGSLVRDAGTRHRSRQWFAESQQRAVVVRLLRSRKGAIGTVSLLVLTLLAIASPAFAPYDPNALHLEAQLAAPSSTYWFGTDELGRDILSRIIYATRPAIQAGLSAVFLAAAIGTLTGLLAGYLGGWLDSVIMRVWDALLAFPSIFLAIGIVTILGPGWINAVLAIAIINMPIFSRVVRAATLAAKEKDYAEAAWAIGCTRWQIMRRHLFPNCVVPAIVLMAIAVPEAILVEASLSFLGLGSQPPDASWGNMLSGAQGYLSRSATYAVFPGLAIVYTVVAMNFFADGLQDAIDPRRGRH